MSSIPLPVWFIPGIVVVFWIGVCSLLSVIGGWRALARRYEAQEPFTGQRFRFRSGQLNRFTNYNGCLHLGAGPQGLYLSVFFLFSAGHDPLLIPWSDITFREGKRLFFKITVLTFSKVPNVTLRLHHGLAQKLFNAPGAPGLRS